MSNVIFRFALAISVAGISGSALAAPPANAIDRTTGAGINLQQTIMSNAGGGNGGEYASSGLVLLGTEQVQVSGLDGEVTWRTIETWGIGSTEIDPGKSTWNRAKEAGSQITSTFTVCTSC